MACYCEPYRHRYVIATQTWNFSQSNSTSCCKVDVIRGVGRSEPVLVEVVVGEVLAVVVGGHVVDVDLVALLQVVEEESVVGHVEDQLLHLLRETVQVVGVLAVSEEECISSFNLLLWYYHYPSNLQEICVVLLIFSLKLTE